MQDQTHTVGEALAPPVSEALNYHGKCFANRSDCDHTGESKVVRWVANGKLVLVCPVHAERATANGKAEYV